MIQNVLQDIGAVGLYGVISMCLFFLVFSGAMLWAFALKEPHLKSMSALPLDDGQPAVPPKGDTGHE